MKSGPTCSWCGAAFRGRTTCPRGPACAKDEANHETLMRQIAAQDKDRKRA